LDYISAPLNGLQIIVLVISALLTVTSSVNFHSILLFSAMANNQEQVPAVMFFYPQRDGDEAQRRCTFFDNACIVKQNYIYLFYTLSVVD